MEYHKYAKELIGCMVENQQNFKFCHHDVSEIARGEGAVLIYLMDGHEGANASEISQQFDINSSRVAGSINALSKKDISSVLLMHRTNVKLRSLLQNKEEYLHNKEEKK